MGTQTPMVANRGSNIMTDSSGFQDCEGQNSSALAQLNSCELNRCDEIDVVEIEKIEIKEHTLSNTTDLDPSEVYQRVSYPIGVLPTIPEERKSCHCDFLILVMCGVGMLYLIIYFIILILHIFFLF